MDYILPFVLGCLCIALFASIVLALLGSGKGASKEGIKGPIKNTPKTLNPSTLPSSSEGIPEGDEETPNDSDKALFAPEEGKKLTCWRRSPAAIAKVPGPARACRLVPVSGPRPSTKQVLAPPPKQNATAPTPLNQPAKNTNIKVNPNLPRLPGDIVESSIDTGIHWYNRSYIDTILINTKIGSNEHIVSAMTNSTPLNTNGTSFTVKCTDKFKTEGQIYVNRDNEGEVLQLRHTPKYKAEPTDYMAIHAPKLENLGLQLKGSERCDLFSTMQGKTIKTASCSLIGHVSPTIVVRKNQIVSARITGTKVFCDSSNMPTSKTEAVNNMPVNSFISTELAKTIQISYDFRGGPNGNGLTYNADWVNVDISGAKQGERLSFFQEDFGKFPVTITRKPNGNLVFRFVNQDVYYSNCNKVNSAPYKWATGTVLEVECTAFDIQASTRLAYKLPGSSDFKNSSLVVNTTPVRQIDTYDVNVKTPMTPVSKNSKGSSCTGICRQENVTVFSPDSGYKSFGATDLPDFPIDTAVTIVLSSFVHYIGCGGHPGFVPTATYYSDVTRAKLATMPKIEYF